MKKLQIRLLQFRMRLNIDPWARAANRRYARLQHEMELERIRAKAITYEATHTEEIVIGDVDAEREGGETTFDLPKRVAPAKEEPYRLDATGIDVVFDPTDEDTTALMTQHGFGNVHDHVRSETLGDRVDSSPPDVIEWDGPESTDPFAKIKHL